MRISIREVHLGRVDSSLSSASLLYPCPTTMARARLEELKESEQEEGDKDELDDSSPVQELLLRLRLRLLPLLGRAAGSTVARRRRRSIRVGFDPPQGDKVVPPATSVPDVALWWIPSRVVQHE